MAIIPKRKCIYQKNTVSKYSPPPHLKTPTKLLLTLLVYLDDKVSTLFLFFLFHFGRTKSLPPTSTARKRSRFRKPKAYTIWEWRELLIKKNTKLGKKGDVY